MASVARVLGAVCVVLALVIAGFGVYVFVQGETYSTSSPELDDLTSVGARVYLVTSLVTALILATIGSGAMSAGSAAKAANRIVRDRRPSSFTPPPAYGAQSQAPSPLPPVPVPVPVPAAAAWRPTGPGPQPVDGGTQPAGAPGWGPPSGPPAA